MSDALRFDIQGARKELGDEATFNYLRKDLKTNIDWEYLDSIDQKSALDTLQQNDFAIFGKVQPTYNIHTQAKKDYELNTPKEYKPTKEISALEDKAQNALEFVTDILDFKALINPIYKKITDKDLPENILMTKEREEYLKNTRENIRYKLDNNLQLSKPEIDRIISDEFKENFWGVVANNDYLHNKITILNAKDANLEELNKEIHKHFKDEKDILNVEKYEDLNENQKGIIDRSFSIFDDISDYFTNKSDNERLKEYKERKSAEIISKKAQEALVFLENTDPNSDIFSLISNLGEGKEDTKKRNEYLNRVESIALSAGFNGIATDAKYQVYFFKEDAHGEKSFYKPNTDFFANFKEWMLSNTGSIAGSLYGFKKGYEKGGLKKGVIYSAGGAMLGGALDYALASQITNRENNFQDMLRHALQEGTLNLALDLGAQGLKIAGTKLTQLSKNASNPLGTITDYLPIVGTVKRWHSGNSQAAYELVKNTMSKEQLEGVKKFAKEFGGEVELHAQKESGALKALKEKFGEDSAPAKIAQKLENIFALKNQTQAQKEFIQAVRADESGNLIGFLTQVAKDSPKLHANLNKILNTTTKNLMERLESFNIDKQNIKSIFDSLEKGTKNDYREAVEGVLEGVYNSEYKTIINQDHYNGFRKQLDEIGVLPEDSMRFLNFVEKNIYNKEGVTFTQLNNALKNLNSYYKQSLDPNFKNFVKQAVDKRLKEDIQAGIKDIFSQNSTLYKDAQTLFATALSDYAKMKDTLKVIDRLKVRDSAQTQAQALENVFKYLKGQGGDISNYSRLTQSLSPESKAFFELQILQGIFKKTLKDFDNVKVFDSNTFFKRLEELGDTFKTKEAKDYIEIARGFHTLFKNDTLIAQSLGAPVSKEVGSSIATSIQGAVKFQVVKILFEAMMRLMPKIPFAKGFNEKIQGMALRYHLRKALQQSIDIGDFKFQIQKTLKNPSINTPTRTLLEKLTKEVDSLQDEIIENVATKSKEMPIDILRENTAQNLNTLINKPLTNANDNRVAFVTKRSIEKMLSDKAVQKSVANGFSKEQHFKAVNNIENLYKKSKLVQTQQDKNGEEYLQIHRYLADIDEHSQAKITLKEVIEDKNRIYSLELEVLPSKPLRSEAFGEQIPTSRRLEPTHPNAPAEIPINILPQKDNPATLPKEEGETIVNKSQNETPTNAKDLNTDQSQTPTLIKTKLEKPLSHDEIKAVVSQWDLNKPKSSDKLLISKVQGKELEQLTREFNFKGNYTIAREIDAPHLAHTLNRHSNESIETSRNQIPITKDEILNYQSIIKNHDTREIKGNKIIYKKQINGHYVVVEEALTGKNKLSFITMWKSKGDINATTPPTPSINRYDLDRTLSGNYSKDILPQKDNPATLPKEEGETIVNKSQNETPTNAKDLNTDNQSQTPTKKETPTRKTPKSKEEQNKANLFKSETFKDTQGKTHTLSPEIKEQWLKTFNLKSLEEDFIPTFSPEIKEALQNKEVKLTKGSLYKLIQRDRAQYIPQIKETLETPEIILKDIDDLLILAKQIDDKQYFTSVNLETQDCFITVSNTPKKENILKNKVEKGAKVIYQSPNAKSIFYTDTLLQVGKSPTNKTDKDILLQKSDDLIKTNELLNLVKNEAQKLKKDPRHITRSKESKDYDFAIFKPEKLKEFEKQNFNQIDKDLAKKLFKDFPQTPTQIKANKLRICADEDAVKETILQGWREKFIKNPFINSYFFLKNVLVSLKDNNNTEMLKKLGFDEIDIKNTDDAKFKTAFKKLQASFKKGDFLGLDEIIIPEIIQTHRKEIEAFLNIKPLKEFGTNYAEFYADGKGAIDKLLTEKSGQVTGAFYRKDLEELSGSGDITLVWGDSKFGLSHILDKHPEITSNILNSILQNGKLIRQNKTRYRIEKGNYVAGLSSEFKGEKHNFILTSFERVRT